MITFNDDKLIAEFMANRDENGVIENYINRGFPEGTLHFTLIPGSPINYIYPEGHKYFCGYGNWGYSWSLLMCVVEKIERDYPNYDFIIDRNCAYIKNNVNSIVNSNKILVSNQENNKMIATYKTVIEFIKIHNNEN